MLPMASRDISSLYVLNIYFVVYPVNPRRVRGAPKIVGGCVAHFLEYGWYRGKLVYSLDAVVQHLKSRHA